MSIVRQSIEIGSIFTELTAMNVIGSGSFGTVYLAQMLLPDKKLSKDRYAVKRIPMCDAEAILGECDTLYKLRNCKNVIELLACIVCDESSLQNYPSVYLVFPYFEKTLYKDYVYDISPKELMAYMEKLLSGLSVCHFLGIAHCDITAANVLFNRKTLDLVIIDFGMGRPFHEMVGKEIAGGGTYGYRAPELLLGGLTAIIQQKGQADVWAAGQIFLCLLTGISQWFMSPPNREMSKDGFNLAQMCSQFGCEAIMECGSDVDVTVTVNFPGQKPFPSGAEPIASILSLRGQDSRFCIEIWQIIRKCWQPRVLQRLSAYTALQYVLSLKAKVSTSGDLSKESCASVSAIVPRPTHNISSRQHLLPSEGDGSIVVVRNGRSAVPRVTYDFRGSEAWPFFYPFKAEKIAQMQCPFRTGYGDGPAMRSSCTTVIGQVKRKPWVINIPTKKSSASSTASKLSPTITAIPSAKFVAGASASDTASQLPPTSTAFPSAKLVTGASASGTASQLPPTSTAFPSAKLVTGASASASQDTVSRLLSARPQLPYVRKADGYCSCCRMSFYGTRDVHLRTDNHRQAFLERVILP